MDRDAVAFGEVPMELKTEMNKLNKSLRACCIDERQRKLEPRSEGRNG